MANLNLMKYKNLQECKARQSLALAFNEKSKNSYEDDKMHSQQNEIKRVACIWAIRVWCVVWTLAVSSFLKP